MINMKKKTETDNPFKSLGVGYAHYLRNGAGAHQDKKKEQQKKQCRYKMKASEWKSYFLPGYAKRNRFSIAAQTIEPSPCLTMIIRIYSN